MLEKDATNFESTQDVSSFGKNKVTMETETTGPNKKEMSISANNSSDDKKAQGTSSTSAPPTDTPISSRNKPKLRPLLTRQRNTSLFGNRRSNGTTTTTTMA